MSLYKKSIYNLVINNNKEEKIIYNTRTLGLATISNSEYEMLDNVATQGPDNLQNEFWESMYDLGFVIDKDCDEIKILKYRINKERYSTERLKLTIALTMECNFSCSYCYQKENVTTTHGNMNIDIQDKLIDFIKEKSEKCKELHITWYGGEPLLAYDVLKRLSIIIMSICEEKAVNYSAMIITNGYFLDKYKPKDFSMFNINEMQLTIDGPQEIHDKRRVLKGNKGTYERIIKNIQTFQEYFNLTLRVNIDKDNAKDLDDLINELVKNGIYKPVITLAPVTNYKNSDDNKCMNNKEFCEVWLKFMKECKDNNLNVGTYLVPAMSYFCDADLLNSFVIDSEGYIYKCWENIGNKQLSIDNLIVDMVKNKELYYDYLTYDPTEDVECKLCNILPICMGGCPYKRKIKYERCSKYKLILNEVLRRIVIESNS